MTHNIWYPPGREEHIDLEALTQKALKDAKNGDTTTIHFHSFGTPCNVPGKFTKHRYIMPEGV